MLWIHAYKWSAAGSMVLHRSLQLIKAMQRKTGIEVEEP